MANVNDRDEDIVIDRPAQSWGEFFGNVAYWAFPVTALWGVTKYIANAMAGRSIMRMVFPAVKTQEPDTAEGQRYADDRARFSSQLAMLNDRRAQQQTTLNVEEFNVRTYDDARLRTVEVSASNANGEAKTEADKIYILKACGNGGYYEKPNIMLELIDDAKTFNATTIGFNFRNVGMSEGVLSSTDDLVTDGIAQIERLRLKGASAGNIFLKGHSFGAAAAAVIADYFHQRDYPILIDSSRSFSKLSEVPLGWIRTGGSIGSPGPTGHRETLFGQIKAFFAAPFVRFLFAVTKCDLNAAEAFKRIPVTHKDYYCVRSEREVRDQDPNCIDDTTIPHSASLHTALKPERDKARAIMQSVQAQLREARNTDGVMDQYLNNLDDLSEATAGAFNAHKMRIVSDEQAQGVYPQLNPIEQPMNGHDQPTTNLRDLFQGRTAKDHFTMFVKRALPNANIAAEEKQAVNYSVRT